MASRVQEYDLNLLPPADLAGEIEKLQEDLRNERDRTLRSLADFKNYRRRTEHDGNKQAEEGKRVIILPLLDIIDDMEKALSWITNEEEPMAKGVRIIHGKLLALLKSNGVVPFESLGAMFNHDRHEAVALAEDQDLAPGTVIDELRRGYLWNKELLRAAQVRVSS